MISRLVYNTLSISTQRANNNVLIHSSICFSSSNRLPEVHCCSARTQHRRQWCWSPDAFGPPCRLSHRMWACRWPKCAGPCAGMTWRRHGGRAWRWQYDASRCAASSRRFRIWDYWMRWREERGGGASVNALLEKKNILDVCDGDLDLPCMRSTLSRETTLH